MQDDQQKIQSPAGGSSSKAIPIPGKVILIDNEH